MERTQGAADFKFVRYLTRPLIRDPLGAIIHCFFEFLIEGLQR